MVRAQVHLLDAAQQIVIITVVAEATLLVDETKEGGRGNIPRLKKLKAARASAVIEVNVCEGLRTKLIPVSFDLKCDHVVVEMLLQLLVGVVDAELLKAVMLE